MNPDRSLLGRFMRLAAEMGPPRLARVRDQHAEAAQGPEPRRTGVISASHGNETRRLHGFMGTIERAAITAEGKPGLILVDSKG